MFKIFWEKLYSRLSLLQESIFIGFIILLESILIIFYGAINASITMSIVILSTILLYSSYLFVSNHDKHKKNIKKNIIRVIIIFFLGFLATCIKNYRSSWGHSVLEYEFIILILIYLGMSLLYASIAALGFSFYIILFSGVTELFINLIPENLRRYANLNITDVLFLCWGVFIILSIFK